MRQTVIALPCLWRCSFQLSGEGGLWCDTFETELLTFASYRLRMATKAMLIPFVRPSRMTHLVCILPPVIMEFLTLAASRHCARMFVLLESSEASYSFLSSSNILTDITSDKVRVLCPIS
jgi:hypothetical protein